MRNRLLLIFCLTTALCAYGADPSVPASVSARRSAGTIKLDVRFSSTIPSAPTPYSDTSNWRVQWKTSSDTVFTRADVSGLTMGSAAITLTLKGNLPPIKDDPRSYVWDVSFRSDGIKDTTVEWAPSGAKSCASSTNRRFLCPPSPSDTPDMSFTGSFLTGGGTNPIYSFEVKSGIILPWSIPKPSFTTGINLQVEINQNTTPPAHRTRFDPDSITAGLGFTHFLSRPPGGVLSGMRLQFQPGGEFNRSDPSSNFITSGLMTFDFVPLGPSEKSHAYFTFYPFLGMEVGQNFNRPRVVDSVPVDFSRYTGIARGLAGADTKLAFSTSDFTSDVFSISGSYRLRLPAIDEPFVETIHQQTTAEMTTKARHWVEADIAYTIPSWQYLSVAATYQYGELPPLFPLVDHKLTIGLRLQAVQAFKPKGAKLVQ